MLIVSSSMKRLQQHHVMQWWGLAHPCNTTLRTVYCSCLLMTSPSATVATWSVRIPPNYIHNSPQVTKVAYVYTPSPRKNREIKPRINQTNTQTWSTRPTRKLSMRFVAASVDDSGKRAPVTNSSGDYLPILWYRLRTSETSRPRKSDRLKYSVQRLGLPIII